MRRLRVVGGVRAGTDRSKYRPLDSPVQAGALPTKASLPNRAGKRLLRWGSVHRITQHSDSDDAEFDSISGDERAHPSGRTGGDHVAGIKRHHSRNPANQKSARINNERSIAGLAQRPVDASFHENVSGIQLGFNVRPDRAERVEAFAARELHVALLDVASSDVVEAGVAENVRQGVIRIAQMRAAVSDNL